MPDIPSRWFALLGALAPPTDSDPEKIQRWRILIALAAIVNCVSLGTHIALACGFFSSVYPGFASAADMRQMQATLMEQRITTVESAILEARKNQCAAPSGEVRRLYTHNLQQLLVAYERLTYTMEGHAREYPVPDCSAF